MEAGFKLAAGGRLDVKSDKPSRRVRIEYSASSLGEPLEFDVTPSESRAIAYALTGASNEL